jgi:hypothetical protein
VGLMVGTGQKGASRHFGGRRRILGSAVVSAAAFGLVLSGCGSSSDEETAAEETTAAVSSEFCTQADEIQQKYVAAAPKVAEDLQNDKTNSAEKLQAELVVDMKSLSENLPDEAPADVKTAFDSFVKNLEAGDSNSEQAQADDAVLGEYMRTACPTLGGDPSAGTGGAETPTDSGSSGN